ncbi:Calmodulin-binding domain, plant [Sesbania bispinosa]|nr:Calmodulin-binding domain, plant [Sesbania bispinosa]
MSRGAELRRHSAGIASSGNHEEKVVPHYLRASTGSCHDFCKYGRKHVLEAKEERLSIPKRAGRKPLHQSSEESIGGTMTSVAKLRASIDSEPAKMTVVKCRESKPTTKRLETSLISTSKKEEPPFKSTSKKVKTYPKSTLQVVKTSSNSTSKTMQTSSKLSSFEGKEMELSEKHVASLNPDSVTMQTKLSMNSLKGFCGQRNSEIKMEKRKVSCKVASPLRASFSSKPSHKRIASINARVHKSLKIVSHLKNETKPRKSEPEENSNETQEKTLYVIKMEKVGSENQTLQSDQNASQDIELSLSQSLSSPKFSSSSISQSSSQEDQEESDYATSEFEGDSYSGNHEIEYMENVETWDVEENGKPQKDGIECGEDKDCQNLREKLVETQFEKNSLRHKFWRGNVLEENATNVKAGADKVGVITGPEKVVLRHQDMHGKKDGQVLFNDVIEETASKLVVTQKGKVKALVGAFETIISLQEKKHCAHIVN